jgi:TonB-dependent starch-binding outer membrane protein SusC
MLFAQIAMAQTVDVTGKVTEANGTGIPSASVKEKGTRNGVTSDANGNFSITVKQGATLVFSSIGFENYEMPVTGGTMDVKLKADTRSLSEVVVTGVGVATTKKKLAFAVESISADKLPQAPTASIDQALVGKIPGAQISSIDGTPGARANILLRGINTLQRGTGPLILLDGVEVRATDINSLDLTNIERVEVIQGAAAGTVYGAQGANGVIQLFSKKGKKGQTNIDIQSSYGVSDYVNNGGVAKADKHGFRTDATGNVITAANAVIFLDSVNGRWRNVVWPRTILDPNTQVNKAYDKNLKYYDHFAQLFQQAITTNVSLSLNGAGEKMDYAFGLSNNTQESNIKKNGRVSRTNFTANLGIELFKGFKIRSVTQLVYTNSNLNPYYTSGRNSIYEMLNVSPFYDLNFKSKDGNFPYYLSTGSGGITVNGYNPNYYFQYAEQQDDKIDVVQNLQANYKINKFVEVDAKYGINFQQNDVIQIYKNQSENSNSNSTGEFAGSVDNTGQLDNYAFKSTFQNAIVSIFIKTDFEKDFNLKVPITTSTQVSYDYRKNVFKNFHTRGLGLPLYPLYGNNQAATTSIITDEVTPFVTFGYLVNQRFDYGDIGGLSVGFRSDYSSAFGGGSEPQTFGRGDAYIRPSSFDFWKNSKLGEIIPEFKLRAAYGEAGIQPRAFDRYPTITPSAIGSSLSFVLPYDSKNPNLNVEKSKELEVGTDFTFNLAKGRWLSGATLSMTYWDRKSREVIFDVDVPSSTGTSTLRDNAFEIGSNGFQLGLNLNVLNTKDWTWDLTTNFSTQKSMILGTKNGQEIVLTASAGSTSLTLKAGQRIGQINGYKALRSLDATRLDGTAYIDRANYGNYAISSDGYVVDKATKRIQFENESKPIGDGNPDFNMSFINSISYQNYITLGFQFDWISGSHLYNQTKEWMYRDGIHADYARPVTIDGQTAAYAGYYQSAYSDFFGSVNGARNGTKDYFYEDASFVRLRNISFAVDLNHFFKVKTFKRVQLIFTGRNLLTFTKYTGFDPEISSGITNSAFERGLDHNSTPNNKTYQVGLNLGF